MSKALTYGLLFFVMVVWGLNVIAIKVLVEHLPPLLITSLRILLAGMIVFLILIFQKRLRSLTKKEWVLTIAGGLLGMVGNQTFLAAGLMHTTASNAALILALVPLSTSLLAVVFLGDKLTIFRLIGILLALIGISFVVMEGSGKLNGFSTGTVYVFAAMFSQACSFIFINKATKTLDPRQATAVMLTIGALVMFGMSLFMDPGGVKELGSSAPWEWLIFLSSAVLATASGQMFYNMAIQQLGAGQSAIFMNLIPFFSLLGSVLFLGETVHLAQLLGFLFIASGVLFGTGYIDEKWAEKQGNRSNRQMIKRSHSG